MLNEAASFREENTPARSGVDPGRELRVQSALGLQLSWTWVWARVLPPSSLLGEILDAELPSSYQDFSALKLPDLPAVLVEDKGTILNCPSKRAEPSDRADRQEQAPQVPHFLQKPSFSSHFIQPLLNMSTWLPQQFIPQMAAS